MSLLEKLGIKRRSGPGPRHHLDSKGRIIHPGNRVRLSDGRHGSVSDLKPWGVFVQPNPHFGDAPSVAGKYEGRSLTVI